MRVFLAKASESCHFHEFHFHGNSPSSRTTSAGATSLFKTAFAPFRRDACNPFSEALSEIEVFTVKLRLPLNRQKRQ